MHRFFLVGLTISALLSGQAFGADAPPIFVDQGPGWTPAMRADFYTRDQGSQMIPLAWLRALKQPNGQPFLSDSLARYGYLPIPRTATDCLWASRCPGRPGFASWA